MAEPSAGDLVEGDISMVEALRADLVACNRQERRQMLRSIAAPWLRMAVAMPEPQWLEAKESLRLAAFQVDAQLPPKP